MKRQTKSVSIYKAIERPLEYSNLSKKEWDAIRSLADDRNMVIKRADKGFCAVIWDRNDYVTDCHQYLHFQSSHPIVYKI